MTSSRYSFAPGVVTIDFTSPGVAYNPDPGMPDPLFTENDGSRSMRGGDANGDGVVNILDFAIFARANGSTESPPSSNWDRRADFDGNRVVNIFDFQVFALNNGMLTYVPFWFPPERYDEGEPDDLGKPSELNEVDFSFQADVDKVRQGEAVSVDIIFTPSDAVTLFGIDAYVQYDPEVFFVPEIEDYLIPPDVFGWALDQVDMKYDTSVVWDTMFAVKYSKGTDAGPGWSIHEASVPYQLTFTVKDDAPVGPTDLSFRPLFANVFDDQFQTLPVNLNSLTLSVEATGVIEFASPNVPSEYKLSQNYPNPFNPETEIRYQLPEAGSVRLDVFNILGQRVITLVEEMQDAGYKAVTWKGRDDRGADLPSGIYFYTLRAGNFITSRKMILTK
jgi:hypothetical protein